MKGKLIGDILVVKNVPDNLDQLLELPYINRVVKLGHIHGQKRQPDVEMIYGEGTTTIHKENYCKYKIDVAKVMWSKGNTNERQRMSTIPEDNEKIIDMFAGIGYFTIPMSVHSNPEVIHAIEINPDSYELLCENIKLNKVEDVVKPILGDCNNQEFDHIADRVLMGYIGNTHEYLDSAISYLKEDGIIHYHESTPEPLIFKRPIERIRQAAKNQDRSIEILNKRCIKKYSPGVHHTVVDIRVN